MGVSRKVLDWTKRKYDEIDPENDKLAYVKAFGLGAIEGAIDGAVMFYPVAIAALYVTTKELTKLKK